MSAERTKRVDELFHEACALPQQDRRAFLEWACGGDAELLREVERLLVHDRDDSRDPVEDLARGGAAQHLARSLAEDEAFAAPEHIGRYRIIRTIGEGGMGMVYEAEQDDPRRRVALKVVRPGLAGRHVLQRFRAEAQVLGRLTHPGIARIYDAGTAGDQPFFAMELVQGRAITDYARASLLDTRARLALLADVCDAVEHAHRHGVIHRDLKPANVLVTPDGQPKVLDFGVARAIDADVQTATLRTDAGQIVGTVPYMSPEQASGDPAAIDTRSDVYSLGVIAFELLCGRLPYDLGGKLIHEAVRIVREVDPARLSTIDRGLGGDVEAIVAKALEKDPDRRYQSAAAFGADIRRCLADQPIAARPVSTLYQLRKFARRNRPLVAAAAVTFVVLAGATVVSIAFAIRAGSARDDAAARQTQAERQAAIAAAVNRFLNDDLLAAAMPEEKGREVTVLEVLDLAAARIEGRFGQEPAVEAEIRSTIGNSYLALGKADLAEPHFRRALDLQMAELGERDPATLTSLNRLGRLMQTMGRLEDAEALYLRCLDLRREVLGPEAELTLSTLFNVAGVTRQLGRLEESISLYREANEIAARTLPPESDMRLNLMEGLAGACKDLGRHDEAIPIYEEVLEARRRTGPDDPGALRTMNNLAVAYLRAERFEEAHALLVEVVKRDIEVFTERHPTTLAAMTNLARALQRLGRHDEALREFERAVSLHEEVLGHDHRGTLITITSLAGLYRDMGRHDEAESALLDAIDRSARRYGDPFPATIGARHELALLYLETDRPADAVPHAAAALNGAIELDGADSDRTAPYRQTHERCLAALARSGSP